MMNEAVTIASLSVVCADENDIQLLCDANTVLRISLVKSTAAHMNDEQDTSTRVLLAEQLSFLLHNEDASNQIPGARPTILGSLVQIERHNIARGRVMKALRTCSQLTQQQLKFSTEFVSNTVSRFCVRTPRFETETKPCRRRVSFCSNPLGGILLFDSDSVSWLVCLWLLDLTWI
eukprot:c19442_g1_i2.p1 GENE.c19442_g1_i2~~c19442_g1_i2.p1  ORF type:complete len:176 (+),score=40.61 c19442_g1_i2:608-1135(+)